MGFLVETSSNLNLSHANTILFICQVHTSQTVGPIQRRKLHIIHGSDCQIRLRRPEISEAGRKRGKSRAGQGGVFCSQRRHGTIVRNSIFPHSVLKYIYLQFSSTFCLVDKLGTCVVVTVYNLADGKGVIIGDAVAIPEPYVMDVDFAYENNVINVIFCFGLC